MTSHLDQIGPLATAEHLAVETLAELSIHCQPRKILTGSTKRGPAFVYFCDQCSNLSIISVPAGGLRNREPGDPTSRTRLSTFTLADVIVETGAFIESDGTTRARFVVHLPGNPEPEWDLTADTAAAVGDAIRALTSANPHNPVDAPDDAHSDPGTDSGTDSGTEFDGTPDGDRHDT